MRTDRQVTQPSIFSNSLMSTTTTSKPQSSNSSADRGADAAIRTVPPPSRITCDPASSGTIRIDGNGEVSISDGSAAMTVPSGRAVTADFRCSTRCSGTGTTAKPRDATSRRSWRIPSALVRPPRPAYSVVPTLSTSPPSSVPGSSIRASSNPSPRTASSVPASSARRSSAPGRVSTARSPHTTTVSSTNAESGRSSACGTSRISQPAAVMAAT